MAIDDAALPAEPKWFVRPPWAAILWWEKRRPVFNFVVFAAGIVSIALIVIIGTNFGKQDEPIGSPFIQVFVYGIAANACYTLGWVTELAWGVVDLGRVAAQRRKLFRRGMIFSVVLTLLPGVLISALWIVSGLRHR